MRAIKQTMKTKKYVDKLEETEFEYLPTVQKVLSKVSKDRKYQGVEVLGYEAGIGCATKVETCLKDHLQAEHID